MNKPDNFGANLRALKKEKQLSLTEFSAELQIPRTTLQAVLENGHTTLDTACRIADALDIPLSVLTDGSIPPENTAVLHGILLNLNWYNALSPEMQRTAAYGFSLLLEVLQK